MGGRCGSAGEVGGARLVRRRQTGSQQLPVRPCWSPAAAQRRVPTAPTRLAPSPWPPIRSPPHTRTRSSQGGSPRQRPHLCHCVVAQQQAAQVGERGDGARHRRQTTLPHLQRVQPRQRRQRRQRAPAVQPVVLVEREGGEVGQARQHGRHAGEAAVGEVQMLRARGVRRRHTLFCFLTEPPAATCPPRPPKMLMLRKATAERSACPSHAQLRPTPVAAPRLAAHLQRCARGQPLERELVLKHGALQRQRVQLRTPPAARRRRAGGGPTSATWELPPAAGKHNSGDAAGWRSAGRCMLGGAPHPRFAGTVYRPSSPQ